MTRAAPEIGRDAPAPDSLRARVDGRAARAAVDAAVARALGEGGPVLLAISGGLDSMVLLDAAARVARERVAAVATFHHGTGEAADRAAALVERRASELGIPFRAERGRLALGSEAAWRAARWEFLRRAAAALGGVRIATAHTRDDQVETVLMRALRGAGARGLAALYAESGVLRPFLELGREQLAACAAERAIAWVEDPSNRSPRHLRNRVRLDLLPALSRARPSLPDELLALARESAALRGAVRRHIDERVHHAHSAGTLAVAAADLAHYDAPTLQMLWPELAAPLGVALDRRGTERLGQFTIRGRAGSRIQLSGGWEAVHHRGFILLRRARIDGAGDARPLRDGATAGRFRFRHIVPEGPGAGDGDRWTMALPADEPLFVRSWRPGDRMVPHGADAPRRVKGLLRDAGVDGAARVGWPVVLAGHEIVWIPGVRRGSAATVRSGRPVVLCHCERIDR